MVDKATIDFEKIIRKRIVNKPSNLPQSYSKLIKKYDELSINDFNVEIEDIVDEIENVEIRLQKAQI